jgi:phospholipid transport system transporter-binding protein
MIISGIIDAERVAVWWTQREGLFANNLLDLKAVSHVDSAGLAFLVQWAKARQLAGDRLCLTGVSDSLSKLCALYAVEPLFDLQSLPQ